MAVPARTRGGRRGCRDRWLHGGSATDAVRSAPTNRTHCNTVRFSSTRTAIGSTARATSPAISRPQSVARRLSERHWSALQATIDLRHGNLAVFRGDSMVRQGNIDGRRKDPTAVRGDSMVRQSGLPPSRSGTLRQRRAFLSSRRDRPPRQTRGVSDRRERGATGVACGDRDARSDSGGAEGRSARRRSRLDDRGREGASDDIIGLRLGNWAQQEYSIEQYRCSY